MNRRSFFKSLAILGTGAAVTPQIFIPNFNSGAFIGRIEFSTIDILRNCEVLVHWRGSDDLLERLYGEVVIPRNANYVR